MMQCVIAPTADEAYAEAKGFLLTRGIDLDAVDDATREVFLGLVNWGGPDELGQQFETVKAMGIDGITCALPANGHNPERVELLGQVASKVFGPN